MKYTSTHKSILLVLLSLLIFSCDLFEGNKPEREETEDIYLTEYKKVKRQTKSSILLAATAIDLLFEDIDISFIDEIANDVEVYTIKYNTTFQGNDVVASGLVVVPRKGKDLPILSLQNGTNVEKANAPSVNPQDDLYQLLNVIASTGFIIAMPDYLGFGASADMHHPYMHKASTVQSIVDMLKAVKELANGQKIAAQSSKDVYIAGYSQGGWSTMCLQKALELQYQDAFNLIASSCGAGPYNLETVTDYVRAQSTYNMPYFLAYVFNTMLKTGSIDQATIDKIVKAPYAAKIATLFDGKKTGGEINAELTKNVADLLTKEFINNYATSPDFKKIRDELQSNSVGFWKTSVPTKLFHGTTDESVPFTTSQEAYDKLIELGVDKSKIELITLPGRGHTDAIIPTEIKTIEWFLKIKNGN